jgi:hypothetical protein
MFAVAVSMGVAQAAAAEPLQAALVEDLTGKLPRVEFMDYVRSGQVIRLAPHQTIVLSYASSCLRETITGATIIVGTDQSEVQGGEVIQAIVPCDTGRVVLTGGVTQAGGRSFRGGH